MRLLIALPFAIYADVRQMEADLAGKFSRWIVKGKWQ